MREHCLRCLRSKATCFCQNISPFSVGFDLVLLQHPNERRSTVTTARMTHLCIAGSRLLEGAGFDGDPRVESLLSDAQRACFVLYPGPKSVDIGGPQWSAPRHQRLTVFVIDGTWATAAKMLRISPRLAALPRISFQSGRLSEYSFKRQPKPECLSTIEAVHELVSRLDPFAHRDNLMRAFRRMVESQLTFARLGQVRTVKDERP